MCGRFTLKTPPDQWGQLLLPLRDSGRIVGQWQPRYNIAPTQDVLALTSAAEQRIVDYYRWGLIPSWADNKSIGSRMINARSETLHEKASFARPLEKQRCLILADGYYEWQKLPGGKKQASWIAPKEGGVIALAGLWDTNWKVAEQPLRTCTIITTAANSALTEVHDRMPVMLNEVAAERWLSQDCDSQEAQQLLGAASDEFFEVHKVSSFVNNANNESPECLAEIEE